jgi:WD40 repeat protein
MIVEPIATLNLSTTLPGDYFTSMSFMPDSRYLVAVTRFSRIVLWDLKTQEAIQQWQGRSETWKMALSYDGKYAGLASDDGLQLANLTSKGDIEYFQSGLSSVKGVAFHPSSNIVAYGSDHAGTSLQIRNVETADLVAEIGHPYGIGDAQFSPDGRVLMTTTKDEVCFWSIWGGPRLDSSFRLEMGMRSNPAFTGEWEHMAILKKNGVVVYKLESRINDPCRYMQVANQTEIPYHGVNEAITCLAFNPAGTILAIGGDPIMLVDLTRNDNLIAPNPEYSTGQITFNHEGDVLAVCGRTGGNWEYSECAIRLWKVAG